MSIGNVSAYFTQTALVMRPTFTQGATGAVLNTYSSQSEVSGLLRPRVTEMLGGERVSADKLTLYADYRFYCAATADILQDDNLVIDSKTYRVRLVSDVMNMGRLMQVDLKEVGHDA